MARAPRLPQGGPSIFDVDPTLAEPDSMLPEPEGGPRRALIVEGDGGSRGNPGPAAYGALVRDAASGEVLNSEGLTLGVTTNNVAEYSALVAGLEMAREIDPAAELEVRMDSRLVVEQMAGRWKVKHPAMKPLVARARQLVPPVVTWTWVPREQNKAADALVNAALDGSPRRRN
jgi:probable phosphoglycerate mutase